MEKKKVLVIGAGMGGLSAGSYLAMNGYDVELFEMSRVAGGVCTAWHRGELPGRIYPHGRPSRKFYPGVYRYRPAPGGVAQKAPEDRQKILEMIQAIRKLAHFPFAHSNPQELTNLWERARELVRMVPYMGFFSNT
ncbi:MAG: NAD(P)-binding protein [Haliscomenobacter sp.]|nr:NAD(P)-binding protein [Haliscomenobacter sp.]